MNEMLLHDQTSVERFLIEDLNLMRLVLGGLVKIHSDDGRYANNPGEMPLIPKWIHYQLQHQSWVTNHR
ncbi:MAG TPA: hypothetical protein PLD88_05365, partial [Candidatus Berkiella sp.]|nr:hypothetical protein [Candidatus Berkiella sp.]